MKDVTAADRDYDENNDTATVSGGKIDKADLADPHDDVHLDKTAHPTGKFDQNVVGRDIHVTVTGFRLAGKDAENYKIVQPTGVRASIKQSRKPLTVTLEGTASKIYDGTTTAPREHLVYTLNGVDDPDKSHVHVNAQNAKAAFAARNAGADKQVTVSGLTLTGKANKYTLPPATQAQATGAVGTIDPLPLPVTDVQVADRDYDGTKNATVSGGKIKKHGNDDVTLETGRAKGAFAQKDVGHHDVTVSGYALSGKNGDEKNYALKQPTGVKANIRPKALTARLSKEVIRPYDGTKTAPVKPEDIQLSGIVDKEPVTVELGQAKAEYADESVGAHKHVTVTGLGLAGADRVKGNYTLAAKTVSGTGTIDKRPLTPTLPGPVRKTYDGPRMLRSSLRT